MIIKSSISLLKKLFENDMYFISTETGNVVFHPRTVSCRKKSCGPRPGPVCILHPETGTPGMFCRLGAPARHKTGPESFVSESSFLCFLSGCAALQKLLELLVLLFDDIVDSGVVKLFVELLKIFIDINFAIEKSISVLVDDHLAGLDLIIDRAGIKDESHTVGILDAVIGPASLHVSVVVRIIGVIRKAQALVRIFPRSGKIPSESTVIDTISHPGASVLINLVRNAFDTEREVAADILIRCHEIKELHSCVRILAERGDAPSVYNRGVGSDIVIQLKQDEISLPGMALTMKKRSHVFDSVAVKITTADYKILVKRSGRYGVLRICRDHAIVVVPLCLLTPLAELLCLVCIDNFLGANSSVLISLHHP